MQQFACDCRQVLDVPSIITIVRTSLVHIMSQKASQVAALVEAFDAPDCGACVIMNGRDSGCIDLIYVETS
eukprot:m.275064 g.275064  ORF g.275064 m.275064 type:complete len:71 (-) comp16292_c0_seq19:296-508(-)